MNQSNRKRRSSAWQPAAVLALTGLFSGCGDTGADLGDDGRAQLDVGETGSLGAFSPKAFLEAETPWRVIRIQGPHRLSCTTAGGAAYPERCTRDKEYTFFDVRPQQRQSSIHTGVGTPLFKVVRKTSPVLREVEITYNSNVVPARLDGTSISSRLQFDSAQTITATRTGDGLYDRSHTVGHVEGKKGNEWVRLAPFSYYYHGGDDTSFGVSSVEQMYPASIFREGTYLCRSDAWRLTENFLQRLVAADTFDMEQCEDGKLLASRTQIDLSGLVGSLILGRQDSQVNLYDGGAPASYLVRSRREWACLFDCDGTTYSIHTAGESGPAALHIESNRWNIQSNSQFKIKVVRADWNGDGQFSGLGADLRDVAGQQEIYREIVAVVVSEAVDGRGDGLDAQWTQNTYVMFPPVAGREEIFEEAFRASSDTELLYDLKLLDAALALMPDQTPNSPELADVEEKADELRLVQALTVNRQLPDPVHADLLFDVYSEYDATTAASWQHPGDDAPRPGKIRWLLDKLGRRGGDR
jgi:hypothetical protein